MTLAFRLSLSVLLLSGFMLATGVARADFNDGVYALMQGDNDKALQTFMPLAESANHAYAQYFLGRMYAEGRGVEKNPETAAKWFRQAAEQGVQDAQYRLGGMYQRGEGVPQDMEYAYAWYTVAKKLGSGKASAALENSTQLLSAEELVSAKKLAEDLSAKYGKQAETAAAPTN